MARKPSETKQLKVFKPSPRLQGKAKTLLGEYSQKEIARCMGVISTAMGESGDQLSQAAAGAYRNDYVDAEAERFRIAFDASEDEEEERLHDAVERTHKQVEFHAEGNELQQAASDIRNVIRAVKAVSEGEALDRDVLSDKGNNYLPLVDRLHPRLPSRMEKCLGTVLTWCTDQIEILDTHATSKAKWKTGSPEEITEIEYATGLLVRLSDFAEAMMAEIKTAEKQQGNNKRRAG